MAKTKLALFNSISELTSFENVSGNVSDKYVPIYTSEIIKILEPEFKFVSGEKYCNFNSQHSVFLENDTGDTIIITNSYDRTRAFSASLIADEIRIPLNLDKQIHLGSEAAALTENFKENKVEFFKAIEHAKDVIRNLKSTNIPDYIKEVVIEKVFAKPLARKGFLELDLTISDNYVTCFTFINSAITRYVNGEYNIALTSKTHVDGEVIRKGVKTNSRFIKLQITNEIYSYLKDEIPELFI